MLLQGADTRITFFDQRSTEVGNIPFGISNVAQSGCGAVAIYNVLCSLGAKSDLEGIIADLQKQKALLLWGLLGTSYSGVANYFVEAGYQVSMVRDVELFDYLIANHDAVILWYTWFSDYPPIGMHFFFVKEGPNGAYGFNQYRGLKNAVRKGISIMRSAVG